MSSGKRTFGCCPCVSPVIGHVVGWKGGTGTLVVKADGGEHKDKKFLVHGFAGSLKPGDPVQFEVKWGPLPAPNAGRSGMRAVNVMKCFSLLVLDGSPEGSDNMKSLFMTDATHADSLEQAAEILAQRRDLAALLMRCPAVPGQDATAVCRGLVLALAAVGLGLRVVVVVDDAMYDILNVVSSGTGLTIEDVCGTGKRRPKLVFLKASSCEPPFGGPGTLDWKKAMGASGLFLELGDIASREFFDFLDRWIRSLPEGGKTRISVKGKMITASDLNKSPYIGLLLQAFLEGRFTKLLEEW
ncbi:MAG: hypothetical protein FJY76_02580 [Candidatus Aenigmarchaeota archaeon]|nr:hypothetical protein [Candidatus Aenigmarchaeota archaeon]